MWATAGGAGRGGASVTLILLLRTVMMCGRMGSMENKDKRG